MGTSRGQQDENVAEVLKRHGYTTAAIVTNPAARLSVTARRQSFSVLARPPMRRLLFPGTFLLQLRQSRRFDAFAGFMVNAVLRNFSWISNGLNREAWVEARAVFASAGDFSRGRPP